MVRVAQSGNETNKNGNQQLIGYRHPNTEWLGSFTGQNVPRSLRRLSLEMSLKRAVTIYETLHL